MTALLWALVALPVAAGALLATAGRAADRLAAPVAVAAACAGLVLACLCAAGRPAVAAPFLRGLPVRLAVPGLSAFLVVTVAAVTLAVLVFAAGELGHHEARARFFGLMLLFSAAMQATVTASTLPVLLMGWEVMGATSWALIGYWWRDSERVTAAGTAFLTTRAADLGLYLAAGAALAGGRAPGLALDALPDTPEPWRSFLTAGLVVAALGKSAQLPFSFWLSRAMRGPSAVSALLHSAAMVAAGAYLLLRSEELLDVSAWAGPLVAWTGAVTAVALGLVAVAQTDLKQLLAASTCAQIGFIVLAAGVGGTTGGTLQLVAHAAAKSAAFLAAGAWLTVLGTQRLSGLRGAARRDRTVGSTFTVCVLCLAGLPPFALWASKDLLLAAALKEDAALYGAGLAAAVVSAVYGARALWFVWRPRPAPAGPAAGPRSPGTGRVPRPVSAPAAVLASACLALTVPALPPLRDAVERVLGSTGDPSPHAWEPALSGGLALAAAAAAWAVSGRGALPSRGPSGAWFRDWLRLEAAAHTLVVRPVLRLAHGLAAADGRLLDRAVGGAARGMLGLARGRDAADKQGLDRAVAGAARGTLLLARFAGGPVERCADGAVEGVAAGARRLGRLARRPQTGQVHQYLAQAATAFTVLAVVFVLVR